VENEDEKISEGFILLARRIIAEDSWVRQLKPQYFKVMVMLLLKARWKAGPYFTPSREELKVDRGQYAAPVRRLAKECGVSYQVMRTSLGLLARRGFLTHKVTQGITVVTILNYERYQDVENYINAIPNASLTQGQRKPNAQKKQGNTSKEGKKHIPEEKMRLEEKMVFNTWNEHPNIKPTHHVFTEAMRKALRARLKNYSVEQICQGIKNYGDSTAKWPRDFREGAGWTLDQFLSRGAGQAGLGRFLDGPINDKTSRTGRQFTGASGDPEEFIR